MIINLLLIFAISSTLIHCNLLESDSTSLFRNLNSENDALQQLENLTRNIVAEDLITSISRGWWTLSKKLIIKTHEQGIDLSPVVRSTELAIRKELDELTRLLNKKHSEIATISPAFQWAQSSDHVYLNIKFTYRWNAPGALKIENETVSINDNFFSFSAMGSHSHEKKKYLLELELYDSVDPKRSEWSFGSVGKLSCTLFKKNPDIWPRLIRDQNFKIPNMHIWWEMKEKFEYSNTSNNTREPSISNNTNSSLKVLNSTITDEL
ncbi:CS domain-containing protein [Cryptosporidium felis]|nr:CS domain-containing protein [Cryptosporidium felis]